MNFGFFDYPKNDSIFEDYLQLHHLSHCLVYLEIVEISQIHPGPLHFGFPVALLF